MSTPPLLPLLQVDPAVAAATAVRVRAVADLVLAACEERAAAGDVAREDWRGPHADTFEEVHADLLATGTGLRDRLLSTAGAIESAVEDALAVNRAREAENRRRLEEAARKQAAVSEDRT